MKILFFEEQRFRHWSLWLIIIALNILFLIGIYKQIYLGEPFGNRPMSNSGLVYTYVFCLLLAFLFYIISLKTVITQKAITLKLMPFNLRLKFYKWSDIKSAYIRTYSPLREFGGWGIRGIGGNKAINVSGNMGLQLILKNNHKILIGTQKSDNLSLVIENLKQSDKI